MANDANKTVTLLAAGDIGPQVEQVDQLAELVLPVLRQADLRFGNCERLYSQRAASPKFAYGHGYPHPRAATIWKTAEIDIISLASNHAMNMGPEGLLDTIELLRSMDRQVIGAGKDRAEARKPALVERNGVKIAFLAYCSILRHGDMAEDDKPGIAAMRAHTYYQRGDDPDEEADPGMPPKIVTQPRQDDLQALQDDIRNAKQQADVVVMSIHWGIHHAPKAMAGYQPIIAHAAIDAGADLILGHHPHCLKAIEIYKGKVCFYSLGNFIMTSNPKMVKPANWNRWDLWWYEMDREYLPPNGIYHYAPHSRKTMLAKAIFSKKGVDRISFLPAFINPQAQPAVVPPNDPKFQEIFEYVEWLSDQVPHKFRIDGSEIVVDTGA